MRNDKEPRMRIRRAETKDLAAINALYAAARAFMAANGNPAQWKNGKPTPERAAADVRDGNSYVCNGDGDAVLGVFVFIQGDDPTYRVIQGAWLDEAPYGVVHRIASGAHGVGAFCLDWCFARCGNIRIDTHRDNLPMRRLLAKLGYQYCGIIHLEDGDERLAYQKNVTVKYAQ
jgi:RimJ/RimL family protein N-acetyltransferase